MREAAEGNGPGAGLLQEFRGVFAPEAKDAERLAYGLVGMSGLVEEALHQSGGAGADALGPAAETVPVPGKVTLMAWRPVRLDGREVSLVPEAAVGRDAHAAVEDLHRRRGDAHLHLLAHQRVRHAVEGLLHLDVVVGVHPRRLPLCEDVGLLRQGTQCRLVQFLEKAETGALPLLEGPLIELLELGPEGLVQLLQREEGALPQRSTRCSTLCTPFSTLALSLGFRARAGTMAQP